MSTLNNNQKTRLAMLASRAFNLLGAQARGRGEAWDQSAVAFKAWRHEEVAKACGKAGLRCCSQLDYKAVEAHFLNLLPGQAGQAFNAQVKSHTEAERQQQWLIVAACERWGYHLSFAEALCQAIHKKPLADADARILRLVLITVNKRGAAKAMKTDMMREVAA